MMECKKGEGKGKEGVYKWGGKEEIENVKVFDYSGYVISRNGRNGKHIQKVQRKANADLGKLWSIGDKLCKENWKLGLRLYEAMTKSIPMYGAEIWGWERFGEIEKT